MFTHDGKLHKATINILIAAIFAISLYILFLAFAGYLSRVNLNQSVGNVDLLIYTIDRESRQQEQLRVLEEKRNTLLNRQAELREQQALQNERLNAADSRLFAHFHPIARLFSTNRNIFGVGDRQTFRDVVQDENLSPQEVGDRVERLLQGFLAHIPRDNELTQQAAPQSAMQSVIARLRILFDEFSTDLKDRRSLNDVNQTIIFQLKRIDSDIKRVEIRIDETWRQITQPGDEPTNEQRAVIESFKQDTFYSSYLMLQLPTVVLTLLVTIAAGSLGSTVSFTRKFYEEGTQVSIQKLFLSVCEGVAAAVAIFLLAGAGILMLSQGSNTPNGSVEIGPYMVAFLAFVSGFMAKNAFAKIEEVGRNFFETRDSASS